MERRGRRSAGLLGVGTGLQNHFAFFLQHNGERCIGFANGPTGPPVCEESVVCDPMRVWTACEDLFL